MIVVALYCYSVPLYTVGAFLHTMYLAPLKTILPQLLCSSQDLLQWQLALVPCEAHLHLWVVQ